MPSEFTISRRVEFADTDMAGIMHFSNFFRFAEVCEHEMYRQLGCPIHGGKSTLGWPRVHASFDYNKPLKFGDEVTVHIIIKELRDRAISYGIRILAPNGDVAALGSITVVCVAMREGKMTAVQLPEALAEQLSAAGPPRLTELGFA